VLAVTDEVPDAVLEVARSLGVAVAVEVWAADGERLDPDAHQRRLAALVAADTTIVATIATDPSQFDRMVDVAGPVIAWGGTLADA
jgi:hypothetical protein